MRTPAAIPRAARGAGDPTVQRATDCSKRNIPGKIDDTVMYVPIIESSEAVENIDDIMDVEGVDGCIVGPVDLCISLGIPFRFDHPDYLDALRRVREAGKRTDKPVGHPLFGSLDDEENVRRQIAEGVRLLLIGGDEPVLKDGFRKVIEDFGFFAGMNRSTFRCPPDMRRGGYSGLALMRFKARFSEVFARSMSTLSSLDSRR